MTNILKKIKSIDTWYTIDTEQLAQLFGLPKDEVIDCIVVDRDDELKTSISVRTTVNFSK